MSLTSIVLSGTIKKKAEQKQTPNGNTVTNFMINVTRYDNREKQEKQYPVKVSIWGDAISDMLGKLGSSSSPYDDYAETSSYSGSETDAYSSEQEVPF